MSTNKVHQVGPYNTTCRRTELTYKHSRVVGREASFVDFYKRKGNEVDIYSNRQHCSFKGPIENGRNSEPEAQIFKRRDMGLSFFLGDHHYSRISSQRNEYSGLHQDKAGKIDSPSFS